MARKRLSSGSDSLELLLDTICNTFGGVLFLAMLVSLMLTQTRSRTDSQAGSGDPRPALTEAQLARLEAEVEQLTSDIDLLESQTAGMRPAQDSVGQPDIERLVLEMEAAERRQAELESRRAKVLRQLAVAQAASVRARAAKLEHEREAVAVEKVVEQARNRLSKAVAERNRLVASATELRLREIAHRTVRATGQSPRERETSKSEFGVLLRYGRAYLMKVRRGDDVVVNAEEFSVSEEGDTNRARARPQRGLDLTVSNQREEEIEQLLKSFPPAEWYPCFVVHPDSFDAFVVIKAEAVRLGYEYRVLPARGLVVDRGGKGVVQ